MSNTSLLGSFGGQGNSSLMFRNHLINGCFRVWQRATSQTSDGYGSDDRWLNGNNGSTKTHNQQAFTVGQTDVPGNPQFFSRTVVTSVAGAGNFVYKAQKIEDVRTLSGQTATLSFWAKADAPKNIAIEFQQNFGTGGSPSTGILSIGVTTIALTASWKYYTVSIAVPSISGKTLGTNNDHSLQLNIWLDAGSNLNARTNSLGQQSGTFDIAMVQLEAETATPFERRPIGMELQMCQRYYARLTAGTGVYTNFASGFQNALTSAKFHLRYPVSMRAVPGFAFSNLAVNDDVTFTNSATLSTVWAGTDVARLTATFTSAGAVYRPVELCANNTTSAYLEISAEL